MAGLSGSNHAGSAQRQLLLPVDADGVCMSCKETPHPERAICCAMCGSSWHLDCLENRPETVGEVVSFVCPDCSGEGLTGSRAPSDDGELRVKIKVIDEDGSLSDAEKARRKQELVGGKMIKGEEEQGKKGKEKMNEALAVLSESFRCSFCMQLPERPVTV